MKKAFSHNTHLNLSTKELLAHHDVVFRAPVCDFSYGLPLGDGESGYLLWFSEDTLHITINNTGLIDDLSAGREYCDVTEEINTSLRGGAQMQAALVMLNSYLRRRSMECSAGIDLMEIDRYTGEAKFVKSGAAPSFVIRGGRLFRLCSKTVPIGILRALDAEMIRFTLEKGDVIVMVSDGVSENPEDAAWLCDMLASPSASSDEPADLAQKIIRAACAVAGRRDDATAAVVKVG